MDALALGNLFLAFTNHIVMPFMLPFLLMATLGTMAGAKTDKLLGSAFDLLELFLTNTCRIIINCLAKLLEFFSPHKPKSDKEKDSSSSEAQDSGGSGKKKIRKPRTPKDGDGDQDAGKAEAKAQTETKAEAKEQSLINKQPLEYCSYCNAYKEMDVASRCSSCALPFFLPGKITISLDFITRGSLVNYQAALVVYYYQIALLSAR